MSAKEVQKLNLPAGNPGSKSDNYYLVIGDNGGCAGGCEGCCEWQPLNWVKDTPLVSFFFKHVEHHTHEHVMDDLHPLVSEKSKSLVKSVSFIVTICCGY